MRTGSAAATRPAGPWRDSWCGEWRAKGGAAGGTRPAPVAAPPGVPPGTKARICREWMLDGLGYRAARAAAERGAETPEQLAAVGRSRFSRTTGCGPHTLREIERFLGRHGYRLAD